MDLHQLRAHGVTNVAALGGTSVSPQTFEGLQRHGIDVITLCLDNDEAGRTATARAVEQAARARGCPDLYVVEPKQLAPAMDPDEFVRRLGAGRWRELIDARVCAIGWRARELAGLVDRDSPESDRRAALARSGRWLGVLPPRLAVEQEDAVRVIAAQCGYSRDAVSRSFRARFWQPPRREHALGLER